MLGTKYFGDKFKMLVTDFINNTLKITIITKVTNITVLTIEAESQTRPELTMNNKKIPIFLLKRLSEC